MCINGSSAEECSSFWCRADAGVPAELAVGDSPGSSLPRPRKAPPGLDGGGNRSGGLQFDCAEHQTPLRFEVCSEIETVIKSSVVKFPSIMKWL